MNNVSALSDLQLLNEIQLLVAQERKLTIDVLRHLKEIERRMLHLKRGYSSLFEYAVKELHYSEAAAARRVSAMRLLKECPEISKAIEEGTLNLSSVSAVQTFLKREEQEKGKVYTSDEKRDLLESMKNLSKRECEKTLASLSPESVIPKERKRELTETQTELRIVLNEKQLAKLEKLKELLAHRNRDGSMAGLLELMSDVVLERVDPEMKEARAQKRAEKLTRSAAPKETTPPAEESAPQGEAQAQKGSSRREAIPASVQRKVWIRDRSRCTYLDAVAGKRCECRTYLQIDHVVPVALGGNSEVDNLRLLCAQHNKLEAVRVLGRHTMDPYLRR